MPKFLGRFSMRGFYTLPVSLGQIANSTGTHTFAGFLDEDFAPGKGAGAAFFPFGAYKKTQLLPSRFQFWLIIERRGLRVILASSSLKSLWNRGISA
jgi:hypothetical protein